MAAEEVHIGDVGTLFRGTFKDAGTVVDISSATAAASRQFYFQKPSGEVLTKTGTFTNDGTDGQLQYISIAGDIDEAGTWQWQGYIALGSGHWYSDVKKFDVHDNLV